VLVTCDGQAVLACRFRSMTGSIRYSWADQAHVCAARG
jgi:hypothetical protein